MIYGSQGSVSGSNVEATSECDEPIFGHGNEGNNDGTDEDNEDNEEPASRITTVPLPFRKRLDKHEQRRVARWNQALATEKRPIGSAVGAH